MSAVTDAGGTHWVLTFVCPDRPGIVHALSGAVVAAEGNITESQQFSSDDTGRFFLRMQVESPSDARQLAAHVSPVAQRFGAFRKPPGLRHHQAVQRQRGVGRDLDLREAEGAALGADRVLDLGELDAGGGGGRGTACRRWLSAAATRLCGPGLPGPCRCWSRRGGSHQP